MMMTNFRRARLVTFLLFVLLLSPAMARQDDFQRRSARIAGSILVGGHSIDYARGLSDGFGGRVSGSAAYQRATEWAASQFRAIGIKDVRLEPFTISNGWERISAQARMIAPLDRPLRVRSYGWAPVYSGRGSHGRGRLCETHPLPGKNQGTGGEDQRKHRSHQRGKLFRRRTVFEQQVHGFRASFEGARCKSYPVLRVDGEQRYLKLG